MGPEMIAGQQSIDAVRRFCESVSDRNIQNLELLRAVDGTIDWLASLQKSVEGDAALISKMAEFVSTAKLELEIDPDAVIASKLEQAEKAVERTIALLKRKQQSALDDPELAGENEACVVDEYQDAIDAYGELAGAVTELRKALKTHDEELSEVVGPFETIDELFASLKA